MYFKYAVDGFFKNVESNSGFNFMKLMNPEDNNLTDKYYFFDPNLQFDERFHKRLVYKEYSDREDPFICAMWNMSVLKPIPEQPRQFTCFNTNSSTGTSQKFTIRNVQCATNICWVSNDPEYLLSFEEYMMVGYDRMISLDSIYKIPVTYQNMGDVIEVNPSLKTFKIQGEHTFISLGNKISIFESNNNNGTYTVIGVSILSGYTTISVNESINNSLPYGVAVKNKGVLEVDATILYKDIEFSEFNKLEPTNRGEITFLTQSMDIQYPVVIGSSGSSGIIKEIHYKTKDVPNPKIVDATSMVPPYDEIIIQ